MSQAPEWDTTSLNLELFFCTEVLRLNSLHYGYWEQKEKISLEGIKNAQTRYTETLIQLIPGGVETVLDVGCGVGDVATALAQRGYTVTAISPDKNHAKFFRDCDKERIHFHNVRFEEFDSVRKFDLVLMSESQGYFSIDIGLSQSRRYLKPGGHLLISGLFKKSSSSNFKGCQLKAEYLQMAEAYNFVLEQYVDITENVLPTLGLANRFYEDYVTPSLGVLSYYLGSQAQIKLKMLKVLFAKEFRKLTELRKYYEERCDPCLFREQMEYLRLLFVYKSNERFLFDKMDCSVS